MIIKRKLKKLNKILLSLYVLSTLFFSISNILLTISVSSLVGIETFYRFIGLTILFLILIFYVLYGFIWLFNKRNIKLIIFSFIIIIISGLCIFGSYYINKTYRLIDNINKDEVTFTTNLLTLKDYKLTNNKDTILGMIRDEKDIAGHILAKELISKEKLDKVNIVYYDDYHLMIDDLYDKKINGFFIASNYRLIYAEDEKYSGLPDLTIVVKEYSKKIPKKDNAAKIDITKPFTVLLLGSESLQNDLADSIILITFNPKILTSTILSIPRDSYIPIACKNNKENRINTASSYGTECMIDSVSNLTGIKIDYYFKINFTGIVDLVDALGGVNVNVPFSFCEQNSKRQWGANTIYVKKGPQVLNGEEALALSRNRHTWAHCAKEWRNYAAPLDFGRSQNQQMVIEAMMDKLKKVRNVDDFYKILTVISNNLDSNMQTDQMLSLYDTGKRMLTSGINVEKLYVEVYDVYVNGASMLQIHNKSNEAVVKAMKTNLELTPIELIKTFSFDANINFEATPIGKNLFDSTLRERIPLFSTKEEAIAWGASHNISVKIIEYDKDTITQSPGRLTLAETIKEIIIYVPIIQ